MEHSSTFSPLTNDATPAKLVAGRLVDGKYRLVSPLGRGGMSKVWLANHEALKTELAIKFVDEKLTLDEETAQLTLERFRFEAQISARLGAKTKHIVSVQDAGSFDGIPYLVMELVIGHHLEQEFEATGPVAPQRMAGILEQIADALSVAHDAGIVHRDMKPSNIVVVDSEPGQLFVKVADFGVAKATRDSSAFDRPTETSQGYLVGSPAYMSPEQLRLGGALDERTDIWGMGLVAYEAMTGNLPFVGVSEADLIVLISTAPHEPVTRARPELPKSLDAWFDRVLAKDPAARFQTVHDAARAFRQAIEVPVPVPTPPVSEPIVAPVKPFPTRYVVGALAVAGFAALALFLRHGSDADAATPPPRTEPVAIAAPPSAAPPPVASPEPTPASADPKAEEPASEPTARRGGRRSASDAPRAPGPARKGDARHPVDAPHAHKGLDKSEIQ